jgi:hypothetical protein
MDISVGGLYTHAYTHTQSVSLKVSHIFPLNVLVYVYIKSVKRPGDKGKRRVEDILGIFFFFFFSSAAPSRLPYATVPD